MKWRKYHADDYETLAKWFKAHGWETPPDKTILPPTGFVVESNDGLMLGAGFLYLTNSPLAFLEWLVTDPRLNIGGYTVLKYLIARVQEAAKSIGVHKIMHLCKPDYVNVFEKKFGFKATENATILLLEVN